MKQTTIPRPMEKRKRVRIKYKSVARFLLLFFLLLSTLYVLFQIPITNLYIENNILYKDQEIIEMAGLEDYPSTLKNPAFFIKKALEKNTYIRKAEVEKKGFTKVYIRITENTPLLFDQSNNKNKTILFDGSEVDVRFDVPTLINHVPDTIYEILVKKLSALSNEVLSRISEIQYDPNEVDEGRFLLSMKDGNYVYLSINKFQAIDSYVDIMKNEKFLNRKGILYLDSGNSFKIMEEKR